MHTCSASDGSTSHVKLLRKKNLSVEPFTLALYIAGVGVTYYHGPLLYRTRCPHLIMEKKMETTTIGFLAYNIGVYIGIMENQMETTIVGYIEYNIGVYIGIMENKMKTYIGYNIGVYIGIMENQMETTIMGYIGYNIEVYIGIMEKKMETTSCLSPVLTKEFAALLRRELERNLRG